MRLLQGIFAGAVGVARGSVAFVTDSSNEGRAYAILGQEPFQSSSRFRFSCCISDFVGDLEAWLVLLLAESVSSYSKSSST